MAKPLNTPIAFGLAVAALVVIGLGCGPREASDPVEPTLSGAKPTPDRPLPPSDRAHVENLDGREIGEERADETESLADGAPTDERQIRDRASSTATRSAERERSDRIEPASEAYATEQAELLSELDSPDPEARADAADWIDLEGESLKRMIALLNSDPDAHVRATIVDRLGDEESPAAIAALVAALQDPDPEVVLLVIEVLEFEAEEWLIPDLKPLLAHSDPEVREAAAEAIEFLE